MPDLNKQLEIIQSAVDALKPGPSRIELQRELDNAVAIIEALPHQIAEATSWQDAREAGAMRARAKLRNAVCEAFGLPPKH